MLSQNKSFLEMSDNEDEVLDNFKEKVENTSFILGDSKSQNKNNEDIMNLIGKIDDELSKIDDNPSTPVRKNKSFIPPKNNALLSSKDKGFEAGNRLLFAIDSYTNLEK